ncbi:pyridoxamine 5'-phosphate oxidase family protein [Streptomyces pactum]|uniref:Pyridoxamine 5'-phosphate oxidase family protein n=1 Tax=Streptomyces pactum TaxID=68249 RepID=A0ABS0NLE4_9ACTN|nr:pyridoxamine 5'-phosphate oxidase family protein [Streptomyces pactum]MBH5336021.1 pyridoxamine 5'-phosphate oxidase family protein [Streptomyces pactum]
MLIDAPREPRALDLLGRTSHGRVSVSVGALPHTAVARHIVSGGELLLRLHRGHGYHRACDGQVVAYGADTGHPADRPVPGPAPIPGGDAKQSPGGGEPDTDRAPDMIPGGGADGEPERAPGGELWSVSCVGTARVVIPTGTELNRFGPAPHTVDGEPFDPVYLRVRPKFVTVHHIAGIAPRQSEYAP